MKFVLILLLFGCGADKKPSSSGEQASLYVRLNESSTDPDLLALIQEGSDSISSEIILVTKLDDLGVDDLLDADVGALELVDSKKKKRKKKQAAKKKKKKQASKKKSKQKKDLQTCLADSCGVDTNSKVKKKKKKNENSDANVKDDAKLKKGQKVFRGVRIKSKAEMRDKLLNGFAADSIGFGENGKLKSKDKKKDKDVYVVGSLSVRSAVADASFDQDGKFAKNQHKVVFKIQTKDDEQGVDVNKNSDETSKAKRAALKGKVSPDQILGYWDVTNNGDIGDFHENPYQSKTKRTSTRIGSAIANFAQKISDATKGDGAVSGSKSGSEPYNPSIPGTIIPVSKINNAK